MTTVEDGVAGPLHALVDAHAARAPDAPALVHRDAELSYRTLAAETERVARGFAALGVGAGDRVAIYADKHPHSIVAFLAATRCGAVAVPVNPVLKRAQVDHVIRDSGAGWLLTTEARLDTLRDGEHGRGPGVVLFDAPAGSEHAAWRDLDGPAIAALDDDGSRLAAILYTSGSTGAPKGVMVTQRNLCTGAASVARFLGHRPDDRILVALPLSFDAGLNQWTSTLFSGGCAVLLDYLLPRDVVAAVERHRVTGMTAVPPLWIPVSRLDWPGPAAATMRYVASTGGSMPAECVARLRSRLPGARIFVMYGFTEAFRATYLDPDALEQRPDSIGKPIPFADIEVVRPDGSRCEPDEAGELVQTGPLVAAGYWNAAAATDAKFRPIRPGDDRVGAWSGDTVYRDREGFHYFVGRSDAMIKTSGYRVSPEEVEAAILALAGVVEAVALGIADPELGERIHALVVLDGSGAAGVDAIRAALRRNLPAYMVPATIEVRDALPRNPNGKMDRTLLAKECATPYPPST